MKSPLSILGRDYSVRPDGTWVFTREFLLSRGTCCGSKCVSCPYEHAKIRPDVDAGRPVISMVPSWTETLVHSAVNLVGRTRYCIHPEDTVKSVPVLGGTKTLSSDFDYKMNEIVRDAKSRGQTVLVILDRDENPKSFVDFFSKHTCEIIATHVSSFASLGKDLNTIADAIAGPRACADDVAAAVSLRSYAHRAEAVATSSAQSHLIHALLKSKESAEHLERMLNAPNASILYFIWQNPWMIVNQDTWIASSLKTCFPNASLPSSKTRYTKISENELEKEISEDTILLFSSEPFPFEKSWDEVQEMPFVRRARAAALVDGEVFSWFGIGSIRFLEDAKYARSKT